MASQCRTHLQALHRGSHDVLHTSLEVTALVESAETLSSCFHRQLTSAWVLPKLLSSALRTQLNARARTPAVASGVSAASLCHLLITAWRLCPLASLPSPVFATSDPFTASHAASLLPLNAQKIEEVKRELESLEPTLCAATECPATAPRDTALAVVTSLLLYWHILGSEVSCGTSAEEQNYYRLTLTVWRCVCRWAATPACAEVRRIFLSAWLNTLLRRAIRCPDGAAAVETTAFLYELACSSENTGEGLATVTTVEAEKSNLDELWTHLHLRFCRHRMVELHKRQSSLGTIWSCSVAPILSRAFSRDPPLLAPCFVNAVQFDAPVKATLGVLADAANHIGQPTTSDPTYNLTPTVEAGPSPSPTISASLRSLSHVSDWLTAEGVPVAICVSGELCDAHVMPLVISSLRGGFVEEALELLEWVPTEVLDERGVRWKQRLRHYVAGTALNQIPAISSHPPRGEHAHHGGLSYDQWVVDHLRSAHAALDALATGTHAAVLRPVCDALLLKPMAWTAEVLKDPFTGFFLFAGLTRLVDDLLDTGDAPLARFYLTLMGQLLARCPCSSHLQRLLRLLHRMATAITTMHLSPADYAAPSSRYGLAQDQWKNIKTALEHVQGCWKESNGCSRNEVERLSSYKPLIGHAWMARRCFARSCLATDRTPVIQTTGTSHDEGEQRHLRLRDCTLVELWYVPAEGADAGNSDESGTLWMRRSHHLATVPDARKTALAGASSITLSCPTGDKLRVCASEMADVMVRNRAQLLRGTAASIWEGRCSDTQGRSARASPRDIQRKTADDILSPLSSETDTLQRQKLKETWWRERFDLDQRVRRVAEALETAMGAARVLLLGLPSVSVCEQLGTLATNFAAACRKLRCSRICPPATALSEAAFPVLVAAPYLWKSVSSTSGKPTCWWGRHSDPLGCTRCVHTRNQARRTLLEAITQVGRLRAAAGTKTVHLSLPTTEREVACDDEEGWLDLLLDEGLQGAVDTLATATLEVFLASLMAAPEVSTRTDAHADLLLPPRTHVYLVLHRELHGLPWESVDVCQQHSLSRVPCASYPVDRPRDGGSCCDSGAQLISLRRTLVYRDKEALQSPSCLTDFVARTSAWDVRYAETLKAATTASEGTTSTDYSLLHRLLSASDTEDHLDTYIYAGHKGGEQLLPRRVLYDWIPSPSCVSSSLVLLMGCSSARMQSSALYDSFGLPFAYLTAGVPCVVGCLWDVTDGDIDRLTCGFLEAALHHTSSSDGGTITVGECLAVARSRCKLRYLTGMATVMYGMNCQMARRCVQEGIAA